MLKKSMLIGGQWVEGEDKDILEVLNPAYGDIFATVPKAHKEDVEKAINAAEAALQNWSMLSPFKRGDLLRKASDIAFKRTDEIAKLMTLEQGKPLKEAAGEVEKGAKILRYYAEEGERIYGRIVPNEEEDIESRVIYQPVGIAAAISPWNYPIELLAWKIGGALAAGCTIIAKLPSETPLSPLAFTACLHDAGVPAGVINAITGSGSELGPVLFNSSKVKKIAFTGSTYTGRQVLEGCVGTFKKVSLELGGSLPMVVCKDCNLDVAVAGAVRRSFRNMGQICIAINRIYVDMEIYEQFMAKFVEETKKLSIGDGAKENCDLGPMCTKDGIVT
ncbi:MAG: aldehyde dehydrogenase family protein, partial [Actinobacteria bacterium]|nr:aldehyde dehydrogenase family protein [Actinomycetota bacterium]